MFLRHHLPSEHTLPVPTNVLNPTKDSPTVNTGIGPSPSTRSYSKSPLGCGWPTVRS